ncbi:hypothetical protein GGX14DRAFT_609147 [Mycena pura]|uniref:Arrestin-like N-terminal domain-containing protein n=1 Tax=Mycena pura TaxID=153505 RepID=A0AAD6XXI8_9AGAR|nr:hypothetical protein GGX14DRAFT_609147 [Mycena pura]
MAATSRPEPMNATTHHSKVKVSLTLAKPAFVAGSYISGKMEMECRADTGLGIGIMMVELFAIQELTSRDHSATSTFLHSRRLFQGPGLPPSNAVQPHPVPGEPPLPSNYHQARRGNSTFLFKFPLPSTSPSSINFGGDLARVRYELRASVGVCWKGEKLLVTDKTEAQVVECFNDDPERPEPEGVVVGENGKIWAQAKIVGGVLVAGESACVELQVKNHSTKKNTGLVITLTRSLVLSGAEKGPLQISDSLVTVPYRGQEYIIPPGAEGVASLVFDVPKHARSVKGGLLQGDESAPKATHAIFEVECLLRIRVTMGFGSKDIELDLPVTVVHPLALPELPPPPPQPYEYGIPPPLGYQPPYADPRVTPYGGYPALPMSPQIPTAYIDPQQSQVWLAPSSYTPQPQLYHSPPVLSHPQPQYYFPPPPTHHVYQQLPLNLARSLSSGSLRTDTLIVPGADDSVVEEGKGERAARVSHHLRQSTRNRSASPTSHRYPITASNSIPIPRTLRGLSTGLDANSLSVSPAAGSAGAVISPRPLLSPKGSFTGPSTPKSERVEELERMADEVARKTSNLSGDLPKSALEPPLEKKKHRKLKSPSKRHSKRDREKEAPADKVKTEVDLNKTLPGPPVPTGKVAPPLAQRTRVDTYFNASPGGTLTPRNADDELLPKTPTITARGRLAPPMVTSESGLDALERRLQIEVGTQKVPAAPRPDARSVVAAMDIPAKRDNNADDSAISSLTLAGERERVREREREQEQEDERDRDSDERTHGAKKSSSGRTERGDGERRSGRKKDKDGEPKRMRKAVKGRVAAWLGAIDADAPPDIDPGPLDLGLGWDEPVAAVDTAVLAPDMAPGTLENGTGTSKKAAGADKIVGTSDKGPTSPVDPEAPPNPRSSGFVPVKTFKRDPFQRILGGHPADEAKRITDLWAASPILKDRSPVSPQVTSPTHLPQSIHTDRKVSPPSSSPKTRMVGGRRLAFPPPVDPEVKYDVRSARGGRGGKVTAVAALWASGAVVEDSKEPAPKPATPADFLRPTTAVRTTHKSPLIDKVARNATKEVAPATTTAVEAEKPARRPVIKSARVPAMLSSSHATPMLSSTASLARPPPNPRATAPKPPPTIVESATEVVAGLKGRVQASLTSIPAKTPALAPAPKQGDLAFGQARLRDLIKKYQGQAAA